MAALPASREKAATHAARAADQRSDARRQRPIEQADATAETVLRDVLRPLVDDFRAVLVGEGVLREARLVSETATESYTVKEKGKRGRAKSDAARRPTVADFRRFLADRAERGLPELPPEQQPDDFERFLAEEHERQKEREAQEREAQGLGPRRVPAWRRLVCRGVAADDAGSLVEVRVTATPCNTISDESENGKIEFRAEALRGAACDFRRDSASALVELPRLRVAGERADRDAARQWCARVLSRSAEALMAASVGPGGSVVPGRASDCAPGPAAVHAPLITFPALDSAACPVMDCVTV